MIETQECIVTATRRIAASAADVFAVLADPRRHVSFDGSGMLVDSSDNEEIRAVGDIFSVHMRHPEMGDYVMENHVLTFEPDQLIVWEPRPTLARIKAAADAGDGDVLGRYRWGYELAPDGDGTVVTEFFDCTRSPEWLKDATDHGNGWVDAMKSSLERLEALCAAASPAST